MEIYEFINDLADQVREMVETDMHAVKGDDLGLDRRAGYTLFVTEDCIAVETRNRGSLDYYGGFEYVDQDCVNVVGDYVFYDRYDERVADHITFWENHQ